MNTGVSITPRLVVIAPARASPFCACTSKRNASDDSNRSGVIGDDERQADSLSYKLTLLFLLVLFDESQRRRKEIELFTEPILKISLIGKMESRFTTSRKNNKRRRTDADLRQILNSQS